jgi:uncharacterized protein with HEPN domain
VRSAVVHKLSVIGEAAAKLSGELTSRNPQVPWPQIVAFRNILGHAYFGIDWEIVWSAAKDRCPVLREHIAQILSAQAGDSGDS